MNENDFDRLFDEAFDKMETNSSSDTVDYRPSWNRVKKRIKAEQKKRAIRKSFRNVSIVMVSMILGAVIFGSTPITKAFNPLYQTLRELPGDIATLFFGNQDKTDIGAKTNPPEGENLENEDIDIGQTAIITVTLDEARKKVGFVLPSFGYIPAGYELKKSEIYLLPGEELSNKVRFTFRDKNKTFWVTLSELGGDTTIGSGASKAKIEEVQLKYGKGYLTISDNGSSKLEFLNGNIYIIVIGQLEKEELLLFIEKM